jgi:hypothetical protein
LSNACRCARNYWKSRDFAELSDPAAQIIAASAPAKCCGFRRSQIWRTRSTQKAWLWAYARDDRPFGGNGPPMLAYRFEDSRGGECVERHLAGFAGILQVDGYAAYNRLARPAAAIVATLFDLWEKELPRLSGKSKLAEAIRYALSMRAARERFLTDGRIDAAFTLPFAAGPSYRAPCRSFAPRPDHWRKACRENTWRSRRPLRQPSRIARVLRHALTLFVKPAKADHGDRIGVRDGLLVPRCYARASSPRRGCRTSGMKPCVISRTPAWRPIVLSKR